MNRTASKLFRAKCALAEFGLVDSFFISFLFVLASSVVSFLLRSFLRLPFSFLRFSRSQTQPPRARSLFGYLIVGENTDRRFLSLSVEHTVRINHRYEYESNAWAGRVSQQRATLDSPLISGQRCSAVVSFCTRAVQGHEDFKELRVEKP